MKGRALAIPGVVLALLGLLGGIVMAVACAVDVEEHLVPGTNPPRDAPSTRAVEPQHSSPPARVEAWLTDVVLGGVTVTTSDAGTLVRTHEVGVLGAPLSFWFGGGAAS